jgi:hypothetical protein
MQEGRESLSTRPLTRRHALNEGDEVARCLVAELLCLKVVNHSTAHKLSASQCSLPDSGGRAQFFQPAGTNRCLSDWACPVSSLCMQASLPHPRKLGVLVSRHIPQP